MRNEISGLTAATLVRATPSSPSNWRFLVGSATMALVAATAPLQATQIPVSRSLAASGAVLAPQTVGDLADLVLANPSNIEAVVKTNAARLGLGDSDSPKVARLISRLTAAMAQAQSRAQIVKVMLDSANNPAQLAQVDRVSAAQRAGGSHAAGGLSPAVIGAGLAVIATGVLVGTQAGKTQTATTPTPTPVAVTPTPPPVATPTPTPTPVPTPTP